MTQEQAIAILKSGKNAFVTGPAGSGKTFVLRRYIDWLKDCGANAAICASTGIAATHLDGITIHSWTGMGVRDAVSKSELKDLLKRGYLRRRFSRVQVLIIDEISMLGAAQLDLADLLFREFKQIDAPFGGVQTVFCGDFFQLPPIARPKNKQIANKPQITLGFDGKGEAPGGFAYHSRAWGNLGLKICYLDEQHRQSDKEFLRTLNAIRGNSPDDRARRHLQSRVGAEIALSVEPTKLYTHNVDVDIENNLELQKIGGKEFVYKMEAIGPEGLTDRLQKGCLAPSVLRLKVGARVMFVKNNFEERYVNGTLGVVRDLENGRILVDTANGVIDVGLAAWHITEDGDIKAEINQYPLRLAWAITVHKSQGMSLDAARVDLRQSFEPGMGYVALSRVRSSSGLSLAGFNEMSMRVDESVLEFDRGLERESARCAKEFAAGLPPRRFSAPGKKEKKPGTVAVTREWVQKKIFPKEIADIRKLTLSTIISHCEKIKASDSKCDFSYLAKNFPARKLAVAKKTLKACRDEDGHYPLKPAMELLGSEFMDYNQLRLVRLQLE